MVTFRSLENISLSMLDFIRVLQPNLDIKPGSVARDTTIDLPAQELSRLYVELRNIANLQAISTASGTDLDKLARNFGLIRGTGSRATGVAVFTTNNLDSDINIPANTVLTSRSGFSFATQVATSFVASNSGVYRANGIRLRADLDLAGITDEFALEIAVEAINAGSAGNVGKFGIIGQGVAGLSNVTNIDSFSGGSSTEADAAFRSRVLGIFAGSNTGTALGYINALLVDPRVQDVLTVEPGDTLMTRDGTVTATNDDGDSVIISTGTGGKVDLYIQGNSLQSFTESFIYRDQSGKNDPTDVSNEYVIGQRGLSTLLDFQQRRRLSLQGGNLPFQPVDTLVSVSGSLSGPNFVQKFTDDAGNAQGTFELSKDTDAFGGSVFGFDKLKFISGTIDLSDEGITKGVFNGQDPVGFTDVSEISKIKQLIVINNEVPTVSASDRSLVSVDHTPISSVERVVNLTTGERYVISDSNPDGTAGEDNITGNIKISGNTLPTRTDTLQVNYVWDVNYDENTDYDNLQTVNEFRTVQDSVDWGFANRVVAEQQSVLHSATDGYHVVVEHPASRVINVNTRLSESSVNSSGKLVVTTNILNIFSVLDSTEQEVFFTAANNGSFSSKEITLPTDTVLPNAATATVVYNLSDLFSPDGYQNGTFSGNIIRLPDGVATVGQIVYADYVANVNTLLPTTAISSLPATGSQNQFVVGTSTLGNQPVSNLYDVQSNITDNLKFAPSYLNINFEGIPARGTLTINGTSYRKIEDIIVVTQDGLTVDMATSIRSTLGLSSIPSTAFVSSVAKVERVTLSGDEVSSVDYTFDLLNYNITNTTYDAGRAIANSSLTTTQFSMASTAANLSNNPTTGQRLRVTYYYSNTNEIENLSVTSAGPRISEYKYLFVKTLSAASGFIGLSGNVSGTITVSNLTQPVSGSSYLSTYKYVAPKEGERITLEYNVNRLIADATNDIESVRPITADVLVKAAVQLAVDVTLRIVAATTFRGTDSNLESSAREALTVFLTNNGLESTLDSSDVINATYAVQGVDRVTVTTFNLSGQTGVKQTIQAGRNEFISAGNIEIIIEAR